VGAASGVLIYAFAIVGPSAFGELVRTALRRKVVFPVWAAFAASLLPAIAFWELIRSAATYSTYFWSKPMWSAAF